MLTQPLNAEPGDYGSIIELTEACFPRDKELGGMVPRWGHCFRKDRIRNSLVIRDGEDVVSHVGCIDQTIMVGTGTFRLCGVSSVATRPDHRGRGLMTKLLNESIGFMKEEGFVLSDLGGDRTRYRRFGWEKAGRTCRFIITPRSLSSGPDPGNYDVRELTDTSMELSETMDLHNSSRFGLFRDSELHDILLHRSGKITLMAWKQGGLDAYAVANIDNEKSVGIDEVGGGAGGVISIIRQLLKDRAETVSIHLPPRHPLTGPIRTVSSGWSIDTLRMLRILDLHGLLRDFSNQIGSRIAGLFPGADIELSLGIEGEDRAISISVDSAGIETSEGELRGATVLSGQDMVLLLFGVCSPDIYSGIPREFSAILPLDFYLWKNEGV